MLSMTDHFHQQGKDNNFRVYKPYARGNAVRITDEQWDPCFPLIRDLHHARRTRNQILDVLREHGLEPSVAQLYAKMAKWGLKGYGNGNGHAENQEQTHSVHDRTFPATQVEDCNHQTTPQTGDNAENSSETSSASSDSAGCFSQNEIDSSDTVYETEGPPVDNDCDFGPTIPLPAIPTTDVVSAQPSNIDELVKANATSSIVESTDGSSQQSVSKSRLPSDLMNLVHATLDINEFDKYDILNEVASFLCATCSFSDAFVLFDNSFSFLKDNRGSPMALVFATINCLRSATFREQCQFAGALMGEALSSLRLLSYNSPYAATAFVSLEEIGRELCMKSELGHLNILYTQMQISEASLSTSGPSRADTNEILLHCNDPFLLAKANDRPEMLTQSLEVSSISLGRLVGKLSRWSALQIEKDFNPISLFPSAGFNPSDPVSVARFSTALSCHLIRKWSFLSLAEVLGHCNELLPPDRKDTAARLCKLAIRVLSTLAVYTIYQATGNTLRSVSDDNRFTAASQTQFVSPLASHLDVLSRMGNKQRVLVFAEMHKTLYNRTLVYRQQMDDHCLTAHVRETGFLLAASLIRLKRELNTEVPRPATNINEDSLSQRDSHSPSRKSNDSSSSMRRLARRNLLVPGIMSKNGSHLRGSWARRMSTDSHESWNFTKVTGLPSAPAPPESIYDRMQMNDCNEYNDDNVDDLNTNYDDGDEDMMDMF